MTNSLPTSISSTTKAVKRRRISPRRNKMLVKFIICLLTSKEKKTKNLEMQGDARTMKPGCSEKCRLKCTIKFSKEEGKSLFKAYWLLGS